MEPEVSIVIPSRNEAGNITRLFDAIESQETARAIEVIVIDSGSDDGTVRLPRAFWLNWAMGTSSCSILGRTPWGTWLHL